MTYIFGLRVGRTDNNTYYQVHIGIGESRYSGSAFHRIKVLTTVNIAGRINSEYKGWFERESMEVNEVSVLTPHRRVMYAVCFKARLVALG